MSSDPNRFLRWAQRGSVTAGSSEPAGIAPESPAAAPASRLVTTAQRQFQGQLPAWDLGARDYRLDQVVRPDPNGNPYASLLDRLPELGPPVPVGTVDATKMPGYSLPTGSVALGAGSQAPKNQWKSSTRYYTGAADRDGTDFAQLRAHHDRNLSRG